jgi:hypothetical protein
MRPIIVVWAILTAMAMAAPVEEDPHKDRVERQAEGGVSDATPRGIVSRQGRGGGRGRGVGRGGR